MLWKRLSIRWKLFCVIGGVALLVIIFVSALAIFNMRQGFNLYLAEAELARFDGLEEALRNAHEPSTPGWPDLKDNRPRWNALVRSSVAPPARAFGPRPGRAEPNFGQQPPGSNALDGGRKRPAADPLRLGLRLTLIDANGARVVGGNRNQSVFARRPIMVAADDPAAVNGDPARGTDAKPIGWIGLTGGTPGLARGDHLFLGDQLRAMALTALLALVISVLAAFLVARQFLKPVSQMAAAGNRLSAGDYSVRLDHNREDELGALIDQFNELAKSLETRELAERKWVSNTSHELKTPLAILQAQIEALQDGVRQPTTEMLAKLHIATERLIHLVDDLGLLANAHEDKLPLSIGSEDLAEILGQAADAITEPMRQAGLKLTTDLDPNLTLNCDRFRIRQLVDNLLQNSLHYTEPPGQVQLSGHQVGDAIELTVEDTGPAPNAEAMAQIFDRFFRGEQSRSRALGGSGLGLAICREIARAHGGEMTATQSSLGGLKMVVKLPFDGAVNGAEADDNHG